MKYVTVVLESLESDEPDREVQIPHDVAERRGREDLGDTDREGVEDLRRAGAYSLARKELGLEWDPVLLYGCSS